MAYTRLRYHIVTATKHRRRLIDPMLEEIIYAVIPKRAEELGGRILRIGGIDDHIHLVAAVPPTIALSDFIGDIKAEASKAVNRRGIIEGNFGWQRSFGAFTCDPHHMDGVLGYVDRQKEHHASGNLWTHYEKVKE